MLLRTAGWIITKKLSESADHSVDLDQDPQSYLFPGVKGKLFPNIEAMSVRQVFSNLKMKGGEWNEG